MQPEFRYRSNHAGEGRAHRMPDVWRLTLGLWLLMAGATHAGALQAPGIIHIDALNPGADLISIAEAVDIAARARLGVAILTPHDNAIVEYGLPPLRNLLRMRVSQESIQAYGAREYVETVHATDHGVPEVIAIDGAEAVPAYFWENVWEGQPIVRDLHKHLLVIGLSEPEDYAGIPSISTGFPSPFSVWYVLQFWPAGVILLGAFLMIQARRASTAAFPRSLKPGMTLAIIGVVFCVNGYPFRPAYDQYHGDPGHGPYQAVIDYANARNAMTFWAHPEVAQRMSLPAPWPVSVLADRILFETRPYPNALLQTSGYTGFAIFEEGMNVIGNPGGIWDQTLIEYCAGVRRRPVWAIGEVDFEYSHMREGIGTCQTVFLLNERSRAGVLEAMRNGAMYARRGEGRNFMVRNFQVSDPDEHTIATMGGQVTLMTNPRIRIDLGFESPDPLDLQILLIRGGKIIHTVHTTGDTVITFDDPELGEKTTTFYRFLVLKSGWPVLAANPIFVTKETSRNAREVGEVLNAGLKTGRERS